MAKTTTRVSTGKDRFDIKRGFQLPAQESARAQL